ncbi:MAG: general secretion pathway protein GspB [Burkholderiales bacterium]
MSYILDALKRAESERSRGDVPNIHAPSVPLGAAQGRRVASGPLSWFVVSMLLAVLAAALWWWAADKPVARQELAVDRPLGQPPPTSPQTTAASTEVPTPRESLVSVTATPSPPVVVKPVPPDAVTKLPSRVDFAQPAPQAVDRASTAVSTGSTPGAQERVYAIKELPQEVQAALPPVTVGGASYSQSPASRMLIINGQIYHEGDKLAPDLTLQQIQLRTAVLSFRGYRYVISY